MNFESTKFFDFFKKKQNMALNYERKRVFLSIIFIFIWLVAILRHQLFDESLSDEEFQLKFKGKKKRHATHYTESLPTVSGYPFAYPGAMIYIGQYAKYGNGTVRIADPVKDLELFINRKAIVSLATQREYLIGAYGLGVSLKYV